MENSPSQIWQDSVHQRILGALDSPIGLVNDPDSIISDDILSGLIDKGWDIISVQSPLALRLEYEERIRQGFGVAPDQCILLILFPFSQIPFEIKILT